MMVFGLPILQISTQSKTCERSQAYKCISCNTIVSSEEADSDEENENIE